MRSAFLAPTSSRGKPALMNCTIVGAWRGGSGAACGRMAADTTSRITTANVRFNTAGSLRKSRDPRDRHRRRERLAAHRRRGGRVGRLLLNAPNDLEAVHDPAERSGALRVFESPATEIERRLVVETEDEIGPGRVGLRAPRHRDDARHMLDARHTRAFERNRIESFRAPVGIDPGLD